MPITLLHLGVLAPINYLTKNKVSNISFFFTTVWIDIQSIVYYITGLGDYDHGVSHSVLGMSCAAFLVCVLGFKTWKWVYGTIAAVISHLILDGMVHSDMRFFMVMDDNPLFLDWMGVISLLLLPCLIWLILQIVSKYKTLGRASREDVGLYSD